MKKYKIFSSSWIALFAVIIFVTFSSAISVKAQNTLDATFNAGVTDAAPFSYVSAVQPDGKILVGGAYQSVNGTDRKYIARLNADGTSDSAFNSVGSGPNGDVLEIIVLSDGKILIGGAFSTYNGTSSSKIARLNADGTLDASFNIGTGTSGTGRITSMVIQTDGKIVVAGQTITGYNGITSNGIFRLNADGSFDSSFTSGFATSPSIEQIALQSDGKIIIAGFFSAYGGTSIVALVRVNSNGTRDTTFNAGGSGVDADASVAGLAIQANGRILIGGSFSTYNGTARANIARVSADGSLDTSFVPPSVAGSGFVEFFAIQTDGKILAAGSFDVTGTSLLPVIRMNADGSLDTSFNSRADNVGYHVTLQPDGKVIAAGFFSRFTSGETRNGIVRFNSNGTIDSSFNTSFTKYGSVNTIAQQADGKVLVGGAFQRANGSTSVSVARFNADGTFDTSFAVGLGSTPTTVNFANSVNAIAVQADGKVLVGGNFGSFNGSAQTQLVRLNSNGSLDAAFNFTGDINIGLPNSIESILVQPDGKILIGGRFFNAGGQGRGLHRLNADGSIDTTFNGGNTTANSVVYRILRQTDGKLIIAGAFATYSGTARSRIARLNTDGTLDTSFIPGTGANNLVYDAALQLDGKVIVSGAFTTINGTTRNRVARLNADGTLDTSFDPGTGAENIVYSLSIQPTGKILIGGTFGTFNGATRNRLARLNADGSLDTSFDSGISPSAAFFVRRIINQFDGKPLIGGTFDSYTGISRNNLVRLSTPRSKFDFDNDGKSDLSVFRPSNSTWYLNGTTGGFAAVTLGQSGDKLAPADFDGDGKTDLAVYRPSSGDWIIRRSSDSQIYTVNFGAADDLPVPADYDGDGKADINLFRPSNGVWYRLNSSNGAFAANNWGTSGDKPAIGDFDGDGKADLAVYRPSNGVWYIVNSSTGQYTIIGFGAAEDLIVPGDYDGDGKTDIAVYRPSNNVWYRLNSSNGAFAAVGWGAGGDQPVPADYDGDGKTDLAVYRNGYWYIVQSSNGQIGYGSFGNSTDVPLPNVYVR